MTIYTMRVVKIDPSMDQGNVIPKTTLQLVWHKNSNDKQKKEKNS